MEEERKEVMVWAEDDYCHVDKRKLYDNNSEVLKWWRRKTLENLSCVLKGMDWSRRQPINNLYYCN